MVMITAFEKAAISKKYPRVHIVRTMRQRSARHRYYMAEETMAMKFLKDLRGQTSLGCQRPTTPEDCNLKGSVTNSK